MDNIKLKSYDSSQVGVSFSGNTFSKHNPQILSNSPEGGLGSLSVEIKINNLERRLENTEKMVSFLEEMLRLKEEERKNEYKMDQNKILELNKKLSTLEDYIKYVHKKEKANKEFFLDKLEQLEKKYAKFMENKSSINEFYANKFSDIETILKKNEVILDDIVEQKIEKLNQEVNSKLSDLLGLMNELSTSTENSEYRIIESKESIRNLQKEQLEFIKIISILKEKANTLDYVMDQISLLKERYYYIFQQFGDNSNEEDKFLNKVFNLDNKPEYDEDPRYK